MLRKLMLSVAVTALSAGTAAAQLPMPALHLGGDKPPLTKEEIEKQKALDNAYRAANNKIPNKQPVTDPWGNVRPNPAPAPNKKQ